MKKILVLLYVFLLALTLVGCENTDTPNNRTTDNTTAILQTYLDILQNRGEFFARDEQGQFRLIGFSDYLNQLSEGFDYVINEFAVIDMDSDGINDIILSIYLPMQMMELSLILTYQNGLVHSGIFTSRMMSALKEDGTFISLVSSAEGTWGVMRLVFTDEGLQLEQVSLSPNAYEHMTELDAWFFEHESKNNALWLDFTLENIEEVLTVF